MTAGETIYERAGREEGLGRIVAIFYASIFEDPVLQPVFGTPVPTHVDHLTAFLCEVFGGPTRYSDELRGFDRIVEIHRGKHISEEQRQRFHDLFMVAVDQTEAGQDEQLRAAIESCIDFGTHVAMVNSNATTDAELHPQRVVPHWQW